MSKIRKILMIAGIIGLISIPVFLSYQIGLRQGRNRANLADKPDTLIVDHWDTISVLKPIPVTKDVLDTMWIPAPFFPHIPPFPEIGQSIPIPREQVYYKDSTYEAWVSGFRPSLDSIRIFRHDQTIYVDHIREVTKKAHWGIGVQAGYGAYISNQQVNVTPYVGIGISYNLISW